MTGDIRVWDLRNSKEISFPEGTERIGSHWFYGSKVESVIVPASVTEIGVYAFCNCRNLRHVTFVPGTMLKKIRVGSFHKSGVERITIPKEIEEIQDNVFLDCKSLKEVVFEKGSNLRAIG